MRKGSWIIEIRARVIYKNHNKYNDNNLEFISGEYSDFLLAPLC